MLADMSYKDSQIKEVIRNICKQKRETDYWDVKQEWHKDKGDLIKDIICFANTVHDRDCFLIFGINDDLKICGMNDTRRKQSDIIDTLSNLQFAGDNIPNIEIKTVSLPSDFTPNTLVDIDVLIIYNTYMTPIYLKKNYGKMKQGCIYSRVRDKNTPDNGNAEIGQIEMLWRKRFGLTKSPFEYMIDRLQNKLEWHEYDDVWYNIYKPEYVLQLQYDERISDGADEFYSYSLTNEHTQYSILNIVANGTILDQYQMVSLDAGQLFIPIPEWEFLDQEDHHFEPISYKYYVNDSVRYNILKFMYDPDNFEERVAFEDFMEVVLLFRTEEEKNEFNYYVQNHFTEFSERVKNCQKYTHINTGEELKTDIYRERLHIGVVLNEMLLEYRQQK